LALVSACAQPITQAWPVEGPGDVVAVATPALAGWYAAANAAADSIEIRDINGVLSREITRAEMVGLLPWMSLGPGFDGPDALAWSDSGRLLFILVHDANPAPGAQPSDAILRYDAGTDTLTVFYRLELFDRDDEPPRLAAAHFKGRLYVGTYGFGGVGSIQVIQAGANAASGVLLGSANLPSGTSVHGLAIDRANSFLYAASESSSFAPTSRHRR
jgi:DNA-binding beta-propeller fold protein YncE